MHKTCTSFIITSITHVFYNGEKKVIFLNRMDENGCQMYARAKQLFFYFVIFFIFCIAYAIIGSCSRTLIRSVSDKDGNDK